MGFVSPFIVPFWPEGWVVVDALPAPLLFGKGLTGAPPDELTLLLGVPPRIPRPYSKASVNSAIISKASKIHPHFPHRN